MAESPTQPPPFEQDPTSNYYRQPYAPRLFSSHFSLSAFWFATNVHWTALLLIMVPKQVEALSGGKQAATLGNVLSMGAIMALVLPLLIGPLSDRCMSPFGRRRPYMVVGVGVNVIGLVGMYLSAQSLSLIGFVLAFLLVQLGNNIATSAYNGIIPDVVHVSERGKASGYMGLMSQFGSAVGAIASGLLMGRGMILAAYLVLIITLIVFLAFSVVGIRERPLEKRPEHASFVQILKSLWIDPRKYPDFAWVWITRALVMLGFYTVQPFILYYLRDVIHVENAATGSQILFLSILLAATVSSIVGGAISDKVGRKPVVYFANGLMAAMAIGFIFCRAMPHALFVGTVFGIGYGAYLSVDWALGTDVLPNKEDAGKDMAIWHIAMVLPQSIGAFIGGHTLQAFGQFEETTKDGPITHYALNGYMGLFAVAALALALGAILLRNVRGAR